MKKYKFAGRVLRLGSTPQPTTPIKCNWCNKGRRMLTDLTDINTGTSFVICGECEEKIKDEIDY